MAAATLVQKIIVLSESTSKAKDPIDVLWLDEQTNGASNHAVGSATLTSGQTYTIVVRGNSNVLPNSEGPMVEGNPDDIIYPSDSPGNSLQAAYDYAFAYAGKSGATGLPALRVEDYNLAPGGGWHEIDLGSGGQRVTPIGGWPSSPDAEHRYYLEVAGGGQPIEIWTTDGDDNPSVLSDNNGQYRYEIYEGTL